MVASSRNVPNMTGTIIDDGRLALLDKLGNGGYGVVYRALDTTSDPSDPVYYAVKVMVRPDRGSRQEDQQLQEIKLHQLVHHHPNIVTMHQVLTDESFLYIVLDLCAGGDLFQAIVEQGVYHGKEDLIKRVFLQLIDALQHCHDQGVYHRDLKPKNILCSADGSQVFLSDFGLAIKSGISSKTGCGSTHYMVPEVIGTELKMPRYSTRHADIWALGIVLSNLATGRNPWIKAVTTDTAFADYLHHPDWFRTVLPVSEGLNSIFRRIFQMNQLSRIPLPELRKEIVKLDTFFMSSVDLVAASVHVRDCAASYGIPVPVLKIDSTYVIPTPRILELRSPNLNALTGLAWACLQDSEEAYIFPSPDAQDPIPVDEPLPNSLGYFAAYGGEFVVNNTASSSRPVSPISRPASPPLGLAISIGPKTPDDCPASIGGLSIANCANGLCFDSAPGLGKLSERQPHTGEAAPEATGRDRRAAYA